MVLEYKWERVFLGNKLVLVARNNYYVKIFVYVNICSIDEMLIKNNFLFNGIIVKRLF